MSFRRQRGPSGGKNGARSEQTGEHRNLKHLIMMHLLSSHDQTFSHLQLENIVDALLKNEDVRCLELFLQQGVHEGTIIKCSQHFLTKLDKLICRGLDQKDPKSASLGFAVLHKCGKNLRLPRHGEGVPGLMAQDLLEKISDF
ncbi:uncharacterized protein V6R79_018441 [Siganus canaliculatus]